MLSLHQTVVQSGWLPLLALPNRLFPTLDGDDVRAGLCTQGRRARPDGVCDIGLRKVRVVFVDHPGVDMAQIGRDHGQRDAVHGQMARVGVAQHVKADRRTND